MDEKISLDELLFRGTGIGAIPPERTWQERIKPKHYYLEEMEEYQSKKGEADEENKQD